MVTHRFIVVLLAMMCLTATALAQDYYVMPVKPDPAIVADGDLSDWTLVPNAITLQGKEHATFSADMWDGDDDLSGTVHLAWRPGMFAIAAEVKDSSVLQPYSGRDIWRGDHINFWVDFQPGIDPQRHMFGEGQFHVVVSPGDFADVPPEIYVYRPEGQNPGPGEVAARRTADGYIVEAVIPVERLGVETIAMFKDANFEVAFSDADSEPAKQETLMTVGTEPWVYSRNRVLPMVFGDGNGNAPPPLRGTTLVAHAEVPPTESITLTFDSSAIPDDKQPFVYLKARYPSPKVGGFRVGAVTLDLNGQRVTGDRIANREATMVIMRGSEHTFVTPEGAITLYYTPDYYPSPERHALYGTIDGTNPTEYEFNVAGMIREGKNTLTITNTIAATEDNPYLAHVDDVEFRIKAKVAPPPPPKPAPTGDIPWLTPHTPLMIGTGIRTYTIDDQSENKIVLTVAGEQLAIVSRFSSPDGKWQTGSNAYFTHERQVEQHGESFVIIDTFTNLTDDNLPLMQEHSCDLGDAFADAWLAGTKMPAGDGNRSESDNPSVYATTDQIGIGMYADNDAFIVHVNQAAADGVLSINDHSTYLQPGATYTAKLVVVPTATADFWRFVNAARRARNVNFPLKWSFAFMFHDWPVYEWTDDTVRSFVENKGANFLVQSNTVRNSKGVYARATDFLNADLSLFHDFQTRIRSLFPGGDVKTGIYYHCFLDTTRENDEKYKADRGLDSAGNHINYGGKGAYMHYFIPTLEKGHWGEVMSDVLTMILDGIGADGVFQDEFAYSRAKYVYGHEDGVSADIDRQTHQIIRTKGSATLISLPFRVAMVDRILDRGAPYLINGAPHTRTMVDKHFMAFTETGSMTNCRDMLLHSPVALGDHLTERKYADSYANMHAALSHGSLFVWYSHIFHNHVAPTKYYYPFTPIELYSGYVFGEERIITDRSGYFGWGDDSQFEAHVFNREGMEDGDFVVPVVERDGKRYAEVRLPEGYMVILVRKK
jgi:hypothetical protein